MSKFLLFTLFLITSCAQNEFDKTLKNHNLNIQFESIFNLASEIQKPVILTGKNSNLTLKINIIPIKNDEEVSALVKKNILLLKNQYDFKTVPYPGQITSSSECGTNYFPKFFSHKFFYIKTSANERMTYILCNSDKKVFDVFTAFFLDKKSMQLIITEIFTEDSKFDVENFYQKYFINVKNLSIE